MAGSPNLTESDEAIDEFSSAIFTAMKIASEKKVHIRMIQSYLLQYADMAMIQIQQFNTKEAPEKRTESLDGN